MRRTAGTSEEDRFYRCRAFVNFKVALVAKERFIEKKLTHRVENLPVH